jgi:hypothetical protein
MKKVSLLILWSLFLLPACATVSYLPSNSSITYPPTNQVEVYWDRPNMPYSEIGMIIVDGDFHGEERLVLKLREKAMAIGANGVIVKSPSQSTKVIATGSAVYAIPSRRIEGIAIRFKDELLKPQLNPPEKSITSTPATPSLSTRNIVTVTWTFANIRSGAGNDYPVVSTVKQGDKLTVIGELGDWLNVRLGDGKEGWISNKVVK